MFTGIITATGTIAQRIEKDDAVTFHVASPYSKESIIIGASIAHDGVCLTVEQHTDEGYQVTVSNETLSRTTVGNWQKGSEVNLEQSLKIGDELGGHLVFGHVDGLGEITSIEQQGESWDIHIKAPDTLLPMIAEKGSITVNGISLTVNDVKGDTFRLTIIPYTWENTTLKHAKAGDKVHLEADMLARYVARQMEFANG